MLGYEPDMTTGFDTTTVSFQVEFGLIWHYRSTSDKNF